MEARFYFHVGIVGVRETLMLGSLYSSINETYNRDTHGALNVIEYYGEDTLVVFRAMDILVVVAMILFSEGCPGRAPWFFLIEKFALGVSLMANNFD